VVVAMGLMRMVQMSADQIIHMVSMRDTLMTATLPMAVRLIVAGTAVRSRAGRWVVGSDRQDVLVHMRFVNMMKMAIV
jgi:hypothetical protein